MNLLIADCGLQIADCVLRYGSWLVSRFERNKELSMNRLVTCNLSLVTGDWRMLFPIVTLLSISSYQLPVTSLSGSWSQGAVNKPWRLPMNRLVTGNLSLVTGDLEMLIPSVTMFSISSYKLP